MIDLTLFLIEGFDCMCSKLHFNIKNVEFHVGFWQIGKFVRGRRTLIGIEFPALFWYVFGRNGLGKL